MSSAPAYPITGTPMQSITKKTILGIRLAMFALAGYWLVIFVLTHVPSSMIKAPKISDKLMHFLAFGGLGMLMCYVTTSERLVRRFSIIAIIGMSYAAIDRSNGFRRRHRRHSRRDCGLRILAGDLLPLEIASRVGLAINSPLTPRTASSTISRRLLKPRNCLI